MRKSGVDRRRVLGWWGVVGEGWARAPRDVRTPRPAQRSMFLRWHCHCPTVLTKLSNNRRHRHFAAQSATEAGAPRCAGCLPCLPQPPAPTRRSGLGSYSVRGMKALGAMPHLAHVTACTLPALLTGSWFPLHALMAPGPGLGIRIGAGTLATPGLPPAWASRAHATVPLFAAPPSSPESFLPPLHTPQAFLLGPSTSVSRATAHLLPWLDLPEPPLLRGIFQIPAWAC